MIKKYDSYKNSGLKWMNEIPSNWGMSRLKMVGKMYGGLSGKKESDFNNEQKPFNKHFITFNNICDNIYISKKQFQLVNVEEGENQNKVKKNDLFFLMSSESYEDLGKSSLLLENVEELYLNSFCKGFRINDNKIHPSYLNYQLIGSLHKQMISVEGNGFTRINLRQERILEMSIFVPPILEQEKIVNFLDNKISIIDSLIDKSKRNVELLVEDKNSKINQVISLGLNPTVNMKESRVEWIEKIPIHYKKGRLKNLCNENQRSLSSSTDPDYKLKYIEISDVNSEGEISKPTEYLFRESPSRCRRIVQKGDVIVSTVRTYLKSIGLIEGDVEDLICSTGFSVLTPKKGTIPKYLYYLSRTQWFISKVISRSEGVSYPSIQSHKLMDIDVVFCEEEEQEKIVKYLDDYINKIQKSISIENERIKLFMEYRDSLIFEVVTGKQKVLD